MMFDLEGTNFERGVFELQLERPTPPLVRKVLKLGAIRGRLLALSLILVAAFLTSNHVLAKWLLDRGWASNIMESRHIENQATWTLWFGGLALWLVVMLLRKEKLILSFDRHASELRYWYSPWFAKAGSRQGRIPFKLIEKIKVSHAGRLPKTPYGFIEIFGPWNLGTRIKTVQIKVLSDEQLRIYPTNLSTLTGKTAEGDWTDPGDEMESSKPALNESKKPPLQSFT